MGHSSRTGRLGRGPAADLFVVAAVLVGVQALDLWTTYAIVSSGGREANPLAAAVLGVGGFMALAATKGVMSGLAVVSGVALARRGFLRLAKPAMVAVVLAHVCMVSSNLHQLANWHAAV